MHFINLIILFQLINMFKGETDQLTNLIKESMRLKSTSTSQSSIEIDNNNDNNCQMQINTELLSSVSLRKRETSNVFAGNGFQYGIGCNIFDPKLTSGDKYYVIDLIVYGPNTRVAKAWREQFTTSQIVQTNRHLTINKQLSFHWLGMNTIVCSVSKYNNLINKFTRICQKNNKINVIENKKAIILDENKSIQSVLHKYIWSSILPNITTTTLTSTTPTPSSIIRSTEFHLKDKDLKNFNFNLINMLNTVNNNNQSENNITTKVEVMKHTSNKIIMQKKRSAQPIIVLLVFLIVFSIAIATLVYSTYRRKSVKNYHSVNIHPNDNSITIKINNDSKSSQVSESDIQGSLLLDNNNKKSLQEEEEEEEDMNAFHLSSSEEISSIDS